LRKPYQITLSCLQANAHTFFKAILGVDNLFNHAYQNYLNRTDAINGNTFKIYETGQTVSAKLSAKF